MASSPSHSLLVLQLQVPADAILGGHPDRARPLWNALSPDGSELTSYLVSFLVIAQFWMVHHRVLRGMRGHSEGLAWRNFGFLLALTLMPFTSDLIGRYGTNPVAITLFGLNLVAISLSTQWIFLYAAKHNLIRDMARSVLDERTARVRVILVLGIVTLSLCWPGLFPRWRSSPGYCSSWSRCSRRASLARWNVTGLPEEKGSGARSRARPQLGRPLTTCWSGRPRHASRRAPRRGLEQLPWRHERRPATRRRRAQTSWGFARRADANPTALEAWKDITPLARNKFICWVEDAKQEKTGERRIGGTREELEDGMRRPCCWPGCAKGAHGKAS